MKSDYIIQGSCPFSGYDSVSPALSGFRAGGVGRAGGQGARIRQGATLGCACGRALRRSVTASAALASLQSAEAELQLQTLPPDGGSFACVYFYSARVCVAKSEETSDGSSQLSGPPPRAGVSPARSLSPRRFVFSPRRPRNVVSKRTDGSIANTYENFSKARKASSSGPCTRLQCRNPPRFVTSPWERNSALIPVPH